MFACLLAVVLEVASFGAKGDGVTLDTAAIQRAIDAVAAQGGGEVLLTPGTYRTGTLYLKSHVTLRLARAACLRGSADLKDYNAEDAYPQNWGSPSPENWRGHHLILALEQEDVAVVGEGIIDGNGRAFFAEQVHAIGKGTWRFGAINSKDRANAVRAGQMLVFVECRGVRVEGVRLSDAPCWNCFCHGCENVRIRDVTVLADIRHQNTDGFDIDCCRNVRVSNCDVETGDDCFTVRADVKHLKTPRICEDVRFENCRGACSACGVRIGVGDGTIRNVAFSNLVIRTAGIGVNIQSNYAGKNRRGVDISDVTIEDFVVRDAWQGLTVSFGRETPSSLLRDIHFVRGSVEAAQPVTVLGNGSVTPDNITFAEVDFRVKEDSSSAQRDKPILVEKAGRVTFDRVTLDAKAWPSTADAQPLSESQATSPQPSVTLYVDPDAGDDANDGGAPACALRTLARAATFLRPGSVLELKPGATFHESLALQVRGTPEKPIVVHGNGAILSGKTWQGKRSAHSGVILLRSDYITIENLICEHFRNDGFNVHAACRGLIFRKIVGRYNGDDGFSIHDQVMATVYGGHFYGNDYGIEDIGKSQSAYCGVLAESNRVAGISFAGGSRIVRDCLTRNNGQMEVEVKYEARPAKYYDTKDPFYRPKVLLEQTRIGPGASCALNIGAESCVTLQHCAVSGERRIDPKAEVVELEPNEDVK